MVNHSWLPTGLAMSIAVVIEFQTYLCVTGFLILGLGLGLELHQPKAATCQHRQGWSGTVLGVLRRLLPEQTGLWVSEQSGKDSSD